MIATRRESGALIVDSIHVHSNPPELLTNTLTRTCDRPACGLISQPKYSWLTAEGESSNAIFSNYSLRLR